MAATSEFSIYRILGNDIPLRHAQHNAIENLDYILRHEPEFPGVEKWWVLNRIVKPEVQQKMLELIEAAGHRHIIIPFSAEDHFAAFLDPSGFPKSRTRRQKQRVKGAEIVWRFEWVIRHKSQQVVNINHARNVALVHGQARSNWTLVLDGGVMIPPGGWSEFVQTAKNPADAKYILLPMLRLTRYEEIASIEQLMDRQTEPQIAFRHDARDRFDERMRYGNQNKTELLSRLGIPGPWGKWGVPKWEKLRKQQAYDKGRFIKGGYCARLPTAIDESGGSADENRWIARFEGVALLSSELDVAQAVKHLARQPTFNAPSVPNTYHRQKLEALCIELAQKPIVTILDKQTTAPSGDRQDYFSHPRYKRPGVPDDAASSQGWPSFGLNAADVLWTRFKALLPSKLTPPRRPSISASAEDVNLRRDDRAAFSDFLRNSYALAHGAVILENENYAERARQILENWLINKETRMNPNFRYIQYRANLTGPNPYGLIAARDLWLLPHTVDLLLARNAVSDASADQIRDWCGQLLVSLEEDAQLSKALAAENNISTWTAAMSAALYIFTGNLKAAVENFRNAPARLVDQLDASGKQVYEVKRHIPLHYSLFNLEGWSALVCVGHRIGMELRNYVGQDGESLNAAIRYIDQRRNSFSDYHQNVRIYDQRISVLMAFLAGEQLSSHSQLFSLDRDWGTAPLWPVCMPGVRLTDHATP